jgi:hypothetical protein
VKGKVYVLHTSYHYDSRGHDQKAGVSVVGIPTKEIFNPVIAKSLKYEAYPEYFVPKEYGYPVQYDYGHSFPARYTPSSFY